MPEAKVFFITGEQRSGTTLLSVMLSKHSAILLDGDSVGFRLVECFGNYQKILPYNLNYSWEELQQWLIEIDYKGRLGKLFGTTDISDHASSKSLVNQIILDNLEENGKEFFGDKSPNIHYWANEILALLPSAKFIHLVRDGRAVAFSRKKRSKKNLYLAAQEWVDGQVVGLYHQSILGKENYKFIRYEDLLIDPERTLREICEFLAIDFEQEMLSIQTTQNEENSYVKSRIDITKIDSFRGELSKRQIRRIEKYCGPMLHRFGYQIPDINNLKFKTMTISERIFLSQKESFAQIFRSRIVGMRNRQNLKVKVPVRNRLGSFGLRFAADFFPDRIYKRILRKKQIKNVYYEKRN